MYTFEKGDGLYRDEQVDLIAGAIADETLAESSLDELVEAVINKRCSIPLAVDVADRGVRPDRLRLVVSYPVHGSAERFFDHSGVNAGGQHSHAGSGGRIDITVSPDAESWAESSTRETERVAQAIKSADQQLRHGIEMTNAVIESERASLRAQLRSALSARWRFVHAMRGTLQDLQIPLAPRTEGTVAVPLAPTKLSARYVAQGDGIPEWELAEDAAEKLIGTITGFARALERLPGTASSMLQGGEDTMRDVILFILNANFQGLVSGETFVGEGKSDLLFRWRDRDAFVAECKVWDGPKKFADGVDQLLGRYALWRHSRVAMIVFIRDATTASAAVAKATEAVAAHPRVRGVVDMSVPTERSDFEVLSGGDSDRLARLTVIPVVIPAGGSR